MKSKPLLDPALVLCSIFAPLPPPRQFFLAILILYSAWPGQFAKAETVGVRQVIIETRTVSLPSTVTRQLLEQLPNGKQFELPSRPPGPPLAIPMTQADKDALIRKITSYTRKPLESSPSITTTPERACTISGGGVTLAIVPTMQENNALRLQVKETAPGRSRPRYLVLPPTVTDIFFDVPVRGPAGEKNEVLFLVYSRTLPAAESTSASPAKVGGTILKTIASHVNIDVAVGGGGGEDRHHHTGDRGRADENKLRKDDKVRTEHKRRDHEENEHWTDNRVKIAHDPDIQHDRDAIDFHSKRKEMFARKLQGKPGADEKTELEHHIRTEEDTIRKYEADLARRGG